ncbi:RNA-binding protein 48 [Orchesella cincta]|uniref:RNA-binding protein 48 n=1 Tax=Orchesella cincta TaxID=48709 RepID=A0A1D2MZ11_ORCCI|nr:RNA-binding protein 48 [Orchesella cincta]
MSVTPCEHHVQHEFCTTRAKYRQGKELKAVKVYTINDESQHLLIHNVPSIGLADEIMRLARKFGDTDVVQLLSDYPDVAEFTNVFYVKYRLLRDARQAKKRLDNRSFFGNLLHVCYAPEMESPAECRRKLSGRFSFVQKCFKPRREKPQFRDHVKTTSEAGTSSTDNNVGTWSNLIPQPSYHVTPVSTKNADEDDL